MVWIGLIGLLIAFWTINQRQMHKELYRELQGEKAEKVGSLSKLTFLEQLGEKGELIQLEIKMILRSKRLKQQVIFSSIFIVGYFYMILYFNTFSDFRDNSFIYLLYGIISVGIIGIIMGQYIFTAESAFFDGMMTRKLSILNMLKSKYLLYSFFALFFTFLLLIPVFQGKLNVMFLIANLFYVTGPVFFMIFQNAVFNKTYFDLFDRGMMNWKGQSPNMVIISLITMFLPVTVVLIIIRSFGTEVAYWFMILTGIAFTLASQQWLKWTYNRFLKRKYKNMEGFRSN